MLSYEFQAYPEQSFFCQLYGHPIEPKLGSILILMLRTIEIS